MAAAREKTTFVRADFAVKCLICGAAREEKTRIFRKLGNESSDHLEKQLTHWVKNYIGLVVSQASCCQTCFRRLKVIDERSKYLRDSCKRTVKAATVFAVTAEPLKDGEDFLTGPSGLLDFGVIKMVAASFGKISTPAPIVVQQSAQAPVVQVEQHLTVQCVSVKEEQETEPYPVSLEKNRTTDNNGSSSGTPVTASADRDSNREVCEKDSCKTDSSVVIKVLESKVTVDHPAEDCPIKQDVSGLTLTSDTNNHQNMEIMSKSELLKKRKRSKREVTSLVMSAGSFKKTSSKVVPVVRSKRRIPKRKRHYKDPSIPTVFNCRLCNVEFDKYNKYLEHHQTHFLLYTDKVHNEEASFTEKRMTSEPSDPLTCPVCGRTFATTRQKKDHIHRMHPGPDELYKCKLCENKIASKKSMQSHLLGHAMYLCNKYQCVHCEKKYTSRASLSCHMKKHTTSKPQCPHCAKTFATRGSLTYHVDVMHLGKDFKIHMCDVCGKLFPRQSELEAHKVIHSEARNHLCEICGKTFKKLQNLSFHMKVHVIETPSEEIKSQSCGICSKRFVRITALADHVTVVHEKECILCGVAISSKKMLLKHRRLCKRERKNEQSPTTSANYGLGLKVSNSNAKTEYDSIEMETDKDVSSLDEAKKTL